MSQENFVVAQDVATLMTDAAVKGYTPKDLELICPSFKKLLPYIPQCRAGLRNIAVSAPSVIYKMWLRYSPPTDLAPAENIPQILHNIRNTLAGLPCTADLSLLHCASKKGPYPSFSSTHLTHTNNPTKKKYLRYIEFSFLARRCPTVLRYCKYLRSAMAAAALLYTRKE